MTHSRLWPAVYLAVVVVLLVLGTTVWPLCSLFALLLTLPLSIVLQGVGLLLATVVADGAWQDAIGFALLLGAGIANAVVLAAVLRRRAEAGG